MRRTDREVTGRNEIIDILRRCDTVRLGINGDPYPYIVPLSFGLEADDEEIHIYFHCAKTGMKLELLEKNNKVCLEGDIFYKIERHPGGVTTRYESIIGFGKCEIIDDPEEKKKGIRHVLEHYGYNGFPLDKCMGLQNMRLGKVTLKSITGKRNISEETPSASIIDSGRH